MVDCQHSQRLHEDWMEAPGYKWVMGVKGEIMINVLTYSVLSQLLSLNLRVLVAF